MGRPVLIWRASLVAIVVLLTVACSGSPPAPTISRASLDAIRQSVPPASTAGEPLDATLYYLEGSALNRQIVALHLASGARAQLTNLKGHTKRVELTEIVPSPDDALVAYTTPVNGAGRRVVAIGPSVADAKPVATNHGVRSPRWSPDGSSLYFVDEPTDGTRRILRYQLDNRLTETIATSDDLWSLLGFSDQALVYQACDASLSCRIILGDAETADVLESFAVVGPHAALAEDGGYVVVSGGETEETQIVDIHEGRFVERARTVTGDTFDVAPIISPDGAWVVNSHQRSAPFRAVTSELDSPRVGGGERWVAYAAWTPDSQALVHVDTWGVPAPMYMVSLDGQKTALALYGAPLTILAGDPEGLAP